ncbi:MAG TPA: diadenylate cyclase CdaA [Armatimonadota bacterium]|jgi:diadenylate cyclase
MIDFWHALTGLLPNVGVLDLLDVAIVAYLVYRVLLLMRATRAMSLLRGVALVLLVLMVSSWLPTLNYLLRAILPVALIALVVIFQPELRMALERLGRSGLFPSPLGSTEDEAGADVINEIVEAAFRLAEKGHGALMVMERTQSLVDIIRTGKTINGRVSVELLMTIFNPRTPLHDGAAVIHGWQLLAASCVLPHSERPGLSTETGMRHRAALGLAERTDAVVVVVSEETGNISLAFNGTLSPALQRPQLTERLMELFEAQRAEKRFFFWRK